MKNRNALILLIGILFCSAMTKAQLVIRDASIVSSNDTSIALNTDLRNASMGTHLDQCEIVLTGNSQELSTENPLRIRALHVKGGGDKRMNGEWEITAAMIFQNGFIVPGGKLVFSGDSQPNAHEKSYVRGKFFTKGSGSRVFPIGNDSGFFPAIIPDVSELNSCIGMEVIDDWPQRSFPGRYDVLPDRFWRITLDGNANFPNSNVGLSTNNAFPALANVVVVGSPINSKDASNFGQRSIDDGFLYSDLPVLAEEAIYTLGIPVESEIRIHNVITPNNDQENNSLFIENIDKYPTNSVILMDRWGLVIKKWTNFLNDNTAFDFTTLSAGNYVCVVEVSHAAGRKQISQMVTVLK
jgi:gliding motility-associated-like protein